MLLGLVFLPSFSQEVDRNGRNSLCKVFIKFLKYTQMNSLHLLCAKRADGRTPILLIYKYFQTLTSWMGITLVQRCCRCMMTLPGWHKLITKIIILYIYACSIQRRSEVERFGHLPLLRDTIYLQTMGALVRERSGAAWRGVAFPPGRSSSTHLQPPERRHHIILPFG